MTPKEKAIVLLNTFDCVDLSYQNIEPKEVAKELAILCVKEIIEDNKAWLDDECQDYGVDYQLVEANIEYYEAVEHELLKL